jgi:hypothetical protein
MGDQHDGGLIYACIGETGPYRSEIVINVMPSDFACSYIWPSTSEDTAEVHSRSRIRYQAINVVARAGGRDSPSRIANLGR